MTDEFGAEITEVPEEIRVAPQRRPQRPRRRDARRRLRAGRRARPAAGQPRLRARRLHQQHGHRARRPAAGRRAPRRPDGPGARPDRALPGDLPDHPPVGLHGDRRRRCRMTRPSSSSTRRARRRSCGSRATSPPASEADLDGGLRPAVAERRDGVVVLDFSKLEYMNSGGIGLLVTLLVRAQRGGGTRSSRPACPTTTARSSR